MSDLTSRSSYLFNEQLVASLLQPLGRNQTDYKAYRSKVNLKICEQRNETSGEKELKFEISRAEDYEFLFAETLNNEKYQKLAREHDLTVDFEAFPRAIIQKLLCKNISEQQQSDGQLHSIVDNKPTEISLILDCEKTTCSFELFSKTPISKGRIFALKMSAVRGDQLTSHLLKICSLQSSKLGEFDRIREELLNYREKYEKLEKENTELLKTSEKCKLDEERLEELEDELELVKEERQNMRILAEEKDELIEEMRIEQNDIKKQNEELNEEIEIVGTMLKEEQLRSDKLQADKEIIRRENIDLRQKFERNLEKFKKLLAEKSDNQQSVDLRKLKELENDLKEKDGLVLTLSETISGIRKELEDEKMKIVEMTQTMDQLRTANLEMTEKLQMYRSNRMNVPYMSPSILQGTPPTIPLGVRNSTTPYKAVFPKMSSLSNLSTPYGRTQTSPYSDVCPPPTTPMRNDTTTSTTIS
ncbi:unnamed protein product [Caenorhabditis angaria]|uniref:Spindle assembly abnormal protein 6 N-terminal domain-containing protein n=1 Tax=Caenorhabditis angaria TaxID=860376 RepID=A0A9P1I596_9PELO|nr:unnamed protein product [Caenorhabditis angaria]